MKYLLISLFTFALLFEQPSAQACRAAVATGVNEGVQIYAIKQSRAPVVIQEWLRVASGSIGIREQGGPNRGPHVGRYLRFVGLGPGYPWCMAFAQQTFDSARVRVGAPKGDLVKGAAVRDVYKRSRVKGKLLASTVRVPAGAMMCFMKPNTPYGHVGIVRRNRLNGKLEVIEGNTGPDGGRDGDGVYLKLRPIKGYPSLKTEGFLVFVE